MSYSYSLTGQFHHDLEDFFAWFLEHNPGTELDGVLDEFRAAVLAVVRAPLIYPLVADTSSLGVRFRRIGVRQHHLYYAAFPSERRLVFVTLVHQRRRAAFVASRLARIP